MTPLPGPRTLWAALVVYHYLVGLGKANDNLDVNIMEDFLDDLTGTVLGHAYMQVNEILH